MSVTPTYIISIDADDDFSFGEGGEDISADVLNFEVMRGLETDQVHVADGMRCVLTVNDIDGTYSPEAVGVGSILIGRGLRVAGVYNAVTYNLFSGQIDHMESNEADFQSKIIAYGRWHYADQKIDVPPIPGPVRVDEVLFSIIGEVFFRLPLNTTTGNTIFRLDYSHLDSTNIALDATRQFDAGRSTLTYVTQHEERPTLRAFVTDLVQAEWGWFYESGDGKLVFANRHHPWSTGTDPIAAWDGSEIGFDYRYGDQIHNEIYLDLTANKVLANQVLWTSIAPIRFKAGESTRAIRFLQGDGRLQAVESDFVPTNFIFKNAETSGTVIAPVWTLEPLGTGARLYVRNESGAPIWLQIGAVVTGDALIKETPLQQTVTNIDSRSKYGVQPLKVTLPDFASIETGEDLADFLLGQYSEPRGLVRSATATNDTAAHLTQMLDLDIMDWVTINLPRKNHNASYSVIGMKHTMDMTTGLLKAQFFLTPLARFWRLAGASSNAFYQDMSRLDISAVLGF